MQEWRFTTQIEAHKNMKNFSGWIFEFRPRFFCSMAQKLVKIMKSRNPGLFSMTYKKKFETRIKKKTLQKVVGILKSFILSGESSL